MNSELLGTVCEFNYGEGLREDRRRPGRIPVYGSNGVVGWHDQALTPGPAIIIGRKGSIGEVHFSAGPCWPIDTTYYIDRTKKKCDLRWLYHVLIALGLTHLNKAAAVPGLNREDAYRQRIFTPALPEQKWIVTILEKADRLRRMRRYSRQLGDIFLQSLFLEMFGNPVSNELVWDTELLKDVCQPKDGIKAGPFGSSLKKEFYSKSGVRIYGQEQVIAGDFSVGDYYISVEMFRDFHAYEVKPGDLLFSLVGSFGKVLIVPQGIERGIINPRLLKISPLPSRVDSTFLAQFVQHRTVQSELDRVSHGGTMGILNAGLLKQLRVIVPPLALQESFAAIVHRFERLRSQHREAERQVAHLFQTLLHRAFTGELVGGAKLRSVKRKPSVPARKRIYSPGVFYRRAAIEAYVINALRGDKYLGRTKLEKIDHLIEYHCGIDLERYPVRDAAGPDDYLSRMKLEHLADKRNWFSAHDKKDGSIVRYLPKRGFMSAAHKGAQEIGEKRSAVDSLLVLMRPLDTKRCEIIATLYAAWNDFLLKGKEPTDSEIVHDVLYNWRPEKRLIPERRWLRALKWMRDNSLVPTGQGKPVLHSDSE